MVLYNNMSQNIKKRIYTSIILFLILFLMIINNYAMAYFLIIASVFSVLEFSKMISIIFNKKKFSQLFINLIFIIYIFFFSTTFLILSMFLHLKILIFLILITCVASDIGGFVFGKIFKGPKLTKFSPNKTYYGMFGGFILSLIIIAIVPIFHIDQIGLSEILLIVSISSISQIGDIIISFFKRLSNIKDTGKIIPGHGGLLDRVDGMIFAFPFSYLILFSNLFNNF